MIEELGRGLGGTDGHPQDVAEAALFDQPAGGGEGGEVAAVVAHDERGVGSVGQRRDRAPLVDVERGTQLEGLTPRFEPEAVGGGQAAAEADGGRLEVGVPPPVEGDGETPPCVPRTGPARPPRLRRRRAGLLPPTARLRPR